MLPYPHAIVNSKKYAGLFGLPELHFFHSSSKTLRAYRAIHSKGKSGKPKSPKYGSSWFLILVGTLKEGISLEKDTIFMTEEVLHILLDARMISMWGNSS